MLVKSVNPRKFSNGDEQSADFSRKCDDRPADVLNPRNAIVLQNEENREQHERESEPQTPRQRSGSRSEDWRSRCRRNLQSRRVTALAALLLRKEQTVRAEQRHSGRLVVVVVVVIVTVVLHCSCVVLRINFLKEETCFLRKENPLLEVGVGEEEENEVIHGNDGHWISVPKYVVDFQTKEDDEGQEKERAECIAPR